MKFLVLAMCVCAASAASYAYKPWQPAQQVNQAFAQSSVSAPEPSYRARGQPAGAVRASASASSYNAPAGIAKSTAYNAPAAVSKSSAYNAQVGVAKSNAYNAPANVAQSSAYVGAAAPEVKNLAVYVNKDSGAGIIRSDSEIHAEGFNFGYETQNGIAAQSTGFLKKVDNVDTLSVEGSFKYTSPEGTPVLFAYTADENGYRPRSDLLPVGPPIPDYILRALEYIASQPKKPENQ